MTVKDLGIVGREAVSYSVPQSYWKAIYDELRPVRVDHDAQTWLVLGTLDLTCADGRAISIDLFYISEGPGAFAIGRTRESRVYYRGGDSIKLRQTVMDAVRAQLE